MSELPCHNNSNSCRKGVPCSSTRKLRFSKNMTSSRRRAGPSPKRTFFLNSKTRIYNINFKSDCESGGDSYGDSDDEFPEAPPNSKRCKQSHEELLLEFPGHSSSMPGGLLELGGSASSSGLYGAPPPTFGGSRTSSTLPTSTFGTLSPELNTHNLFASSTFGHNNATSSSRFPSSGANKRRLSSSSAASRATAPVAESLPADDMLGDPLGGGLMRSYTDMEILAQKSGPVYFPPSSASKKGSAARADAPAAKEEESVGSSRPGDGGTTPQKDHADVVKDAVIRGSVSRVMPEEFYNETSRGAVGSGSSDVKRGDAKSCERDEDDVIRRFQKLSLDGPAPVSSSKESEKQNKSSHERGVALGDGDLLRQVLELLSDKDEGMTAVKIAKTLTGEIFKKDVNRVLYHAEKFGQVRMQRNARGKPIWFLA